VKKRLLKVAITTALTVAFAVPAFANPFSDVPAKHWAYDAVNKLAQAGIVDGYNDGTFRGDKTMTRYEMAQIVAKAMTKSLNSDQKALVDKLSKEYAVELNNLGVKVDGLQNQVDNMVKFNGDARVRYYNADSAGSVGDRAEYRVRLGATAKINNDMSLYARFTSGSQSIAAGNAAPTLENAYVKTNLIGMDTKIGRQDYDLGQGLLAGAGSVAIMNGVSLKDGNFLAFAGKEQIDPAGTMGEVYGGQYTFNLGAPITADVMREGGKDYYAVSTAFNLVPGLKISGEYAKNSTDNAKAFQVKAGLGNTGLSVAYKDAEQNAVPFESSLNLKAAGPTELKDFYALSRTSHVKGMEYEYNADLTKNTNLNVVYQDIKDNGKNLRATVNVKF
jgi:hypothetical protein